MSEPLPPFDARWCKKSMKNRDTSRSLGWKWSRLRADHLSYAPYCAKCELLGTEVHHIMPRSTHPHLIYDRRNLMTLCSACHYKIHHGEDTNENKQDNDKSK